MVSITALWMPILIATVLVFFASNLIWMVLRLHRNDWQPLPDEESFAATLNAQDPPPGEYTFPFASTPDEWKSEEWQAKFQRGPVGFLTLKPAGEMGMAKSMISWLIYIVLIQIFIAYLTGLAWPEGASFKEVFRVASTVGILGFAGSAPTEAIWLGRKWSNVAKWLFDGLVYASISAAVFGWLWPA